LIIKKIGNTIISRGVIPESHEIATAHFFNERGFDVEFLVPIDEKCVKTPDIKMNGFLWEIKSPKGKGKYTITHAFKKAIKQSENIIFDLRRLNTFDCKAITQLKKQFELIHKIKRLLIITKSNKLLDFQK
jgi:hypothetical protein